MHENHASIVALHRLKTFFKKSADTFASTQYIYELHTCIRYYDIRAIAKKRCNTFERLFLTETPKPTPQVRFPACLFDPKTRKKLNTSDVNQQSRSLLCEYVINLYFSHKTRTLESIEVKLINV